MTQAEQDAKADLDTLTLNDNRQWRSGRNANFVESRGRDLAFEIRFLVGHPDMRADGYYSARAVAHLAFGSVSGLCPESDARRRESLALTRRCNRSIRESRRERAMEERLRNDVGLAHGVALAVEALRAERS